MQEEKEKLLSTNEIENTQNEAITSYYEKLENIAIESEILKDLISNSNKSIEMLFSSLDKNKSKEIYDICS